MTSSPMMAKVWNIHTRESREMPQTQAENLVRMSRGEFSFVEPKPEGWNREIPRYRISVDLHPSPLARHFFESPITSSTDSQLWQFCEKPEGVKAGEIIETTQWCHLSMVPLNHSATAVRDYFRDHVKSRLPQTPWRRGQLNLDDGLTGAAPTSFRPNLPTSAAAAAPRPVNVSARR